MSHPDVREAAVIAIPDETWGERPLAVLIPLDGGCDEAALNAWLLEHFPKFWLPELRQRRRHPKTGVGKRTKRCVVHATEL